MLYAFLLRLSVVLRLFLVSPFYHSSACNSDHSSSFAVQIIFRFSFLPQQRLSFGFFHLLQQRSFFVFCCLVRFSFFTRVTLIVRLFVICLVISIRCGNGRSSFFVVQFVSPFATATINVRLVFFPFAAVTIDVRVLSFGSVLLLYNNLYKQRIYAGEVISVLKIEVEGCA